MPAHTHFYRPDHAEVVLIGGRSGDSIDTGAAGGFDQWGPKHVTIETETAGVGAAHENMPPR